MQKIRNKTNTCNAKKSIFSSRSHVLFCIYKGISINGFFFLILTVLDFSISSTAVKFWTFKLLEQNNQTHFPFYFSCTNSEMIWPKLVYNSTIFWYLQNTKSAVTLNKSTLSIIILTLKPLLYYDKTCSAYMFDFVLKISVNINSRLKISLDQF